MTDDEKLHGAYYEPDRLWTGNKAIKELHKITSMSKKDNSYPDKPFGKYYPQKKYIILIM